MSMSETQINGEREVALTKLSRSVEGYVVFVTGAASGMGEATAKLFADEGAKVAAVDINQEGLERVVGEIEAAGCEVKGWGLDVSDSDAVQRVIDEAALHFGGH
jgi:3-oxoacyl-[acyl-carrier protein] reductase